MQIKYDALIKNGTWKLVDPPFGTKPIRFKWVYKYKLDGSLDMQKGRLMAKGLAQKYFDYEETFPPITKWGPPFKLSFLWKQLIMDGKFIKWT